jgi:hypothetical protein
MLRNKMKMNGKTAMNMLFVFKGIKEKQYYLLKRHLKGRLK